MENNSPNIIEGNPIGKGLDFFQDRFNALCDDKNLPRSSDALGQARPRRSSQSRVTSYCVDLESLPASVLLLSMTNRTLRSELVRLVSSFTDDFYFNRVKPLLSAVLVDKPDNEIWDQVYHVTETIPPPRPVASSVQQTLCLRNTSSFANSSEYRQYVDRVLKLELGPIHVGLPRFHETFFGRVADLQAVSELFFKKCMEGNNPRFRGGWRGWPKDANPDDVFGWFAELSEVLAAFAEDYKSTPTHQRRPLAQPKKPIQGSTAERKLDIGFVGDQKANKDSRYHWSQILVPGELKSNSSADTASKAWLDIGRYAREVLAAKDTRRFVLGFTPCGSLMRVWLFDRLGGIASENFDINEEGLQFVSTILGFLWMNEEELGFDPIIITTDGQRFIEIERNGQLERLIVNAVITRVPRVAGRAITC